MPERKRKIASVRASVCSELLLSIIIMTYIIKDSKWDLLWLLAIIKNIIIIQQKWENIYLRGQQNYPNLIRNARLPSLIFIFLFKRNAAFVS